MEHEASLLDYWDAIRKWWRVVMALTVTGGLLIGVWTLCFVPRAYRTTTTLLMPEPTQGGASSALAQLAGSVPGGLPGLAGAARPGTMNTYKAILESATMRRKVSERFELRKLLSLPTERDVLGALDRMTTIRTDAAANLIEISVSVGGTPRLPLRQTSQWKAKDRQRRELAADLANCYAKCLNEYVEKTVLFNATQSRIFAEDQRAKAETGLRVAEDALVAFQESEGTVSLTDEVQATVKKLGELEAEKVAADVALKQATAQIAERRRQSKALIESAEADALPELPESHPAVQRWIQELRQAELELSGKQQQYADAHPEVRQLKLRVDGVKQKLTDEIGRLRKAAALGIAPDLAALEVERIAAEARQSALSAVVSRTEAKLTNLPPTMMTLGRLEREVEAKQQASILFAAEAMKARVAEAQQVPTLQVLDEAETPVLKWYPSTTRNGLLGAFLGLFLGIVIALVREGVEAGHASRQSRGESGKVTG